MDALTVDTLAEVLQEPNRPLLTQVLRTLGQDRTNAVLTATLQFEANGGMLTTDGTRRRTPGGTFFQLVRQQARPHERRRLFPRPAPQTPAPIQSQAPPQVLTWDELQAIATILPQGEATVKLTLIGRREVVLRQVPLRTCAAVGAAVIIVLLHLAPLSGGEVADGSASFSGTAAVLSRSSDLWMGCCVGALFGREILTMLGTVHTLHRQKCLAVRGTVGAILGPLLLQTPSDVGGACLPMCVTIGLACLAV